MPDVRVYHLARELGIPSRVVLLYLDFIGRSHSSATSRLTDDARDELRSVSVIDIKRDARQQASARRSAPRGAGLWWDEDDWGYRPRRWAGPDTLTTPEAAYAVGVTAHTIRKWVVRGYLSPVGRRGKANLFTAADVLAADRATDVRNRQPRVTGVRGHSSWRPLNDAARGLTGASLSDLIDTREAARTAGVSSSTIRSWVSRGHLRPVRHRGRSPLFLRQHVLQVARRPPHRTPRKPPVF